MLGVLKSFTRRKCEENSGSSRFPTRQSVILVYARERTKSAFRINPGITGLVLTLTRVVIRINISSGSAYSPSSFRCDIFSGYIQSRNKKLTDRKAYAPTYRPPQKYRNKKRPQSDRALFLKRPEKSPQLCICVRAFLGPCRLTIAGPSPRPRKAGTKQSHRTERKSARTAPL